MAVDERMITSNFKMPIEHELWLKTDGKEGQQFNLAGKDFSNKDLTNSIIIDVIFDGVNMDYADLSYSNLGYCSFKFFRTTFIRTNFSQADLRNTNFSGMLLKEADFSNVILDKCLFAETSLSGARGLETVKLKWIDIGQNGCIKKLYGIEAIRWLQREAEKSL